MAVYTEISQIPLFRYGMIMADPPWSFEAWSEGGNEKNAKAQYDCMTVDELCELPVGHLAAPDCILWLWATNPLLDKAFHVMSAWGFQFKTAGHWVKRGASGRLAFGTGYILRSAGEPFLIGVNGNPKTSRSVRSVIEGPRREHSRKPEQAYRAAQALLPGVQRLDLFSREAREGWDSFGNEVGKFASSEAVA